MSFQRFLSLFLALTLLSFVLTPSLQANSRAESLYREAVMKETGERDPEAAIALYQQAIDRAGSDHRLVSKARLRMGNCLELLGKSKEAEAIYLQIIQESSASLNEAVEAAQANLQKLQTQERKVQEQLANKPKPMVLVKEFQESRFSVSGGLAGGESGSKIFPELALAVRYRISSSSRPYALYGEIGAHIPLGSRDISSDNASVQLKQQTHLVLIAELPHGQQTKLIPEIGAGAAMTSSEISYVGVSQSNSLWSPYLVAGLHLYPQRRVSYILQATYTANPYSTSAQLPSGTQSFGFPASLWTIAAKAQIKIGWTKTVMREQK